MYGYESSATLTTDRLRYNLQTRPLVREGSPSRRIKKLSGKRNEKGKFLTLTGEKLRSLGRTAGNELRSQCSTHSSFTCNS
jgi:hypothetical protein